ncbi:hypothetical protein ACH5RR_017068 [Cinchona calisaya]|uniref:AP2/ERF domain-containing protein n=1 Tax=Cinchona calisaya TaxID=153742 RepID=A0ABD2ZXR2_9GENT
MDPHSDSGKMLENDPQPNNPLLLVLDDPNYDPHPDPSKNPPQPLPKTTPTCSLSNTWENQPPSATIPSPTGGRHPNYRGVRSRSGKWVSEIREPRKTTRIWLGTYPTPEMAAAAYDAATLALKGPDAVLNFPDLASSYPIPASLSAADIRAAAVTAAAAREPQTAAAQGRDCELPDDHRAAPSSSKEIVEKEKDADAVTQAATSTAEEMGRDFVDEEELFDMPNLLVDMAEGMLISPPRMKPLGSGDSPENSDADSLWSYP